MHEPRPGARSASDAPRTAVPRVRRRAAILGFPIVLLALVLAGCAGGARPDREVAPPPPPSGERSPSLPPHQGTFNVTITTTYGPLYVDDLELEFNRRRYRVLFGFWPDRFETMVEIPFAEIDRMEFVGPMPQALFDQALLGREDQDLRPEQAFELRLELRDQTLSTFYAVIPKFRGIKDFQIWEQAMSGNPIAVEYIEFDR